MRQPVRNILTAITLTLTALLLVGWIANRAKIVLTNDPPYQATVLYLGEAIPPAIIDQLRDAGALGADEKLHVYSSRYHYITDRAVVFPLAPGPTDFPVRIVPLEAITGVAVEGTDTYATVRITFAGDAEIVLIPQHQLKDYLTYLTTTKPVMAAHDH